MLASALHYHKNMSLGRKQFTVPKRTEDWYAIEKQGSYRNKEFLYEIHRAEELYNKEQLKKQKNSCAIC